MIAGGAIEYLTTSSSILPLLRHSAPTLTPLCCRVKTTENMIGLNAFGA
jgi:hypothetical protein